MERVVDRLRPRHADVIGKIAVCAKQPASSAALIYCIEMDDLAGGMYTGVGSTCADYLYSFVSDHSERFLETLLHTETGVLTLPAVIPRPIVFDAERDTNIRTLTLKGIE